MMDGQDVKKPAGVAGDVGGAEWKAWRAKQDQESRRDRLALDAMALRKPLEAGQKAPSQSC